VFYKLLIELPDLLVKPGISAIVGLGKELVKTWMLQTRMATKALTCPPWKSFSQMPLQQLVEEVSPSLFRKYASSLQLKMRKSGNRQRTAGKEGSQYLPISGTGKSYSFCVLLPSFLASPTLCS
jgi:hypothetical protein